MELCILCNRRVIGTLSSNRRLLYAQLPARRGLALRYGQKDCSSLQLQLGHSPKREVSPKFITYVFGSGKQTKNQNLKILNFKHSVHELLEYNVDMYMISLIMEGGLSKRKIDNIPQIAKVMGDALSPDSHVVRVRKVIYRIASGALQILHMCKCARSIPLQLMHNTRILRNPHISGLIDHIVIAVVHILIDKKNNYIIPSCLKEIHNSCPRGSLFNGKLYNMINLLNRPLLLTTLTSQKPINNWNDITIRVIQTRESC